MVTMWYTPNATAVLTKPSCNASRLLISYRSSVSGVSGGLSLQIDSIVEIAVSYQ